MARNKGFELRETSTLEDFGKKGKERNGTKRSARRDLASFKNGEDDCFQEVGKVKEETAKLRR